jgi:putative glutamine amidotransferase
VENKFTIDKETWLGGLLKEIQGICNHHQNIKDIGRGLTINAVSEDGFVHGIERINDEEFKLGILWHPEKSKLS